MATLMRYYANHEEAMRAAETLMSAGVRGSEIQILRPPAMLAAGEDRVGTFDDEDARAQREGTFDNEDANRQREGRFDDTGGHLHNVRQEPMGSFADTEGLDRGPRHIQAADQNELLQAVVASGIDREQAARELANVGTGGAILLVNLTSVDSAQVQGLLGM